MARHKERSSRPNRHKSGGKPPHATRHRNDKPATPQPRASAETRAPVEGSTSSAVVQAKMLLNPAGFGFAERSDGNPSIFIPPQNRGGAMDGDEVVVAWWMAPRGPEGAVRSILKRGRTRVTGVLRRQGRRFFIEPDDPRVLAQGEVLGGAEGATPGQVVVGSIVDYPDPWNENFTIQIERELGPPGSLATEEFKILIEHGIDPELPPEVLAQGAAAPSRVLTKDRENRDDLRDLPFMTIDPPDARDFDDAVYVEILGKDTKTATMRVHVAVADVSHYVREGDACDVEATRRCFSTYLPNRAIPMLPPELSSGICSLVPKKDRLAMVATFDVDERGRVVGDADVRAAVIRSRLRLTYEQVAAELQKRGRQPAIVRRRIMQLRLVADRLRAAKRRRGAIELDIPEIKVLLDEDDRERIRDIVHARSTPEMTRAYNLIEELMVAANEAVARLAVKHRLPVVFRVHDRPDEERIERFAAVADLLAVDVDPEKLRTPKGFQSFLRSLGNHPRKNALHALLLRTLAQAEYSTTNLGHFALGSTAYVHFTSPIRRLPDLVTHRAMKAFLRQRGGKAGPEPVPKMPGMRDATDRAHQASDRERATVQAERDSKALFAAMFMRDRIGDRFEGTVSGMSHGGLYVTLDKPPVDGMIRRASLEKEARESFELDELGARMVGTKTGQTFIVGQRLIVEIVGVTIPRRQIELALIGQLTE